MENVHLTHRRLSSTFKVIVLKTAPNGPLLDTKTVVEHARRLKITQNLLQVMRTCCTVLFSYLQPRF